MGPKLRGNLRMLLQSACRNSWSGSDGVSSVRSLVMNGLGMVLPYKQRLRDGVVGWETVSGM